MPGSSNTVNVLTTMTSTTSTTNSSSNNSNNNAFGSTSGHHHSFGSSASGLVSASTAASTGNFVAGLSGGDLDGDSSLGAGTGGEGDESEDNLCEDSDGGNSSRDAGSSSGKRYQALREQDRFLPIANVARIMKISIPKSGKIAKDAKECVQECVSEFVSFITSEASDRCHQEKRKTINGEDILFAMSALGFDNYVPPLKLYLNKYRDALKGEKGSAASSASSGPPPVGVTQSSGNTDAADGSTLEDPSQVITNETFTDSLGLFFTNPS